MSHEELSGFVQQPAERLDVPGVAVGVWAEGREAFARHGVTSLADPLPVDQHALFQLGSVTRTFTATALVRLAASGQVELDAVTDQDPQPRP